MKQNMIKNGIMICMILLLMLSLTGAVSAHNVTISRTITPSTVNTGESFDVIIDLNITGSLGGSNMATVTENYSENDWTISNITADTAFAEYINGTPGMYQWGTGMSSLTLGSYQISYTMTVPSDETSGDYVIEGYYENIDHSDDLSDPKVPTAGDSIVTIDGGVLNIYSTAMGNTNPGAPDPGIPGFVGPNGDGKTDCGAVNPTFITWASTVVDYSPANQEMDSGFANTGRALGPVTGDNFDIVSLGDLDQDQINAGELSGSVTLGFDLPIANGEGPDLAVFENGFMVSDTDRVFAELGYVEVSTDGIVFARFPSVYQASGEVGGYGNVDPTYVYNLVGKHVNAYGDSWGTPFDLNNLAQAPEVLNGSVDLNSINYVRIVDIPGSGDFKDSRGKPIYDAWVTTGSGGLDLEAVGVINIGVVSAPVANFTADVTSGIAPLTVQFNDESTGVILGYSWDFNDDGIVDSTSQNPEFTYETAGTYTASLTVSNTGGSSTETKADYIVSVLPDSPVADFSVDVNSGAAPLTVQFTDLTTNNPISWDWDFESDGIIDSHEQNPSWTYDTAGNYTVTLTASNLVDSDTVTRVNLTSVVNLPPMADFSADPLITLIGHSVQFTDLSTNSPTSWQWDFNNDGVVDSTMQNPNYTYTTAGTYTVNLTVSNPAGSGDEVKSDYIVVWEQASPASNFTYTSDGGSVTITKYVGADGIVIIPAKIEGLPVTTIGARAFRDCSGLTTVIIPDSVTTIGDYAFQGCSGLTAATIPDSVTTISKYAFRKCSALTTVTIGSGVTTIGSSAFRDCSGLTTVTIPDSVTTIDTSAFQDCSGLTTVTIGSGVTSIGGVTSRSTFVFSGCSALTAIDVDTDNIAYTSIDGILYSKDVTSLIRCPSGKTGSISVPKGVTTIGDYAFFGCAAMTTVDIPDSVTSIGTHAFSDCSALTAINVNIDNSVYSSTDGILYNKNITTLIRCPTGKTDSVTIPDGVTTIDSDAFYSCSGLTSVTIPDGVTTIGPYAFYSCSGLTTVIIPDSVTTIGHYTFYACSGLTSVTIPDGVTTVDTCTFSSCTNLTSVNIGSGVTSIGFWSFRGCSGLITLTIPDNVTSIGSSAFEGCTDLSSLTIGNSVITIDSSAFKGCSALTSVDIGNNVTTIGSKAFWGCNALPSVTIPDSVTEISDSAFQGCSALTSVDIGNNVTTIGMSAFRYCTALPSVAIPCNVTDISSSAYSDCHALAAINVDTNNSVYASIDGILYDKDITTLILCPLGKTGSVTIPDSVTSIGDGAFYGCSGLTSLTIPENVTEIGSYAFRDCPNLTSLVFTGNAPSSVNSRAFRDSTNVVAYYQPSATGFTTPEWEGIPCYPILPVLSFVPEEAEVIDGQTTEIVISVDSLPGGLSGYELTVDIDDPAIAEIVDVSYPDWVSISDNSSLPNGSIYIKAVDGNNAIEAGAEDVVLATLTVTGKDMGTTNFTLGVKRLDDDIGSQINATLEIGTLEVTRTPIPGHTNSPRDLDGDGLYEDLTGDGVCSFVDVEVLFYQMDWIEANMPSKVDYNGNGRVDFDDVVALFDMV